MSMPTGRSADTWPPLPPNPPDPPRPRHNPWQPDPRPPGFGSSSASVVMGGTDWLAQRLLDERILALAGELDDETANQTVAALGLLDASGDAPVRLRLSGVSANLGPALTLVDALDLMGAPVHATCLGTLAGPAVAVLAVADRRVAGRHATVHLCEPRSVHGIPGREPDALAAEHARQLRRLQERLADACGRTPDNVAADMRAGRLLTAEEARAYGLLDPTEPSRWGPGNQVP